MTTASIPSPTRRRLAGAGTAVVAVTLTVLSWPVGLLVVGLFGMAAAVWCRHWSHAARIAMLTVGTCVAFGAALVLADFSGGTAILR